MSTSTIGQLGSEITIAPPPAGPRWVHDREAFGPNAAAFERLLANDLGRLYGIALRILRNTRMLKTRCRKLSGRHIAAFLCLKAGQRCRPGLRESSSTRR